MEVGVWGFVAGSAAANAFNIFSYNRDAWTTDVQMVLARRIQKQSLLLAQVGMFREDVIELVEASVTVLKNFALIATLVLQFNAASWLAVHMWSSAADRPDEFVHAAFSVCVGSSFLYLVLAVLAVIAASHMAATCQQEMLTSLVRLPVEYANDELNEAAEQETIEAFETQGAAKIMRLPFVSRLGPRTRSVDEDETPASRAMSLRFMQRQRRRFLRVFKQEETQWNVVSRYSVLFGMLGLSNLLEAYGYFSAQGLVVNNGEAETQMYWSTWIVQFLMTMVDVLMRWAFTSFIGYPFPAQVTEAVMALGGPGCTAIALRVRPFSLPGVIRRVCVPLCFACHATMTCIAMYYIKASFNMVIEQGSSPEQGLAGINVSMADTVADSDSNQETESEDENPIANRDKTPRPTGRRPPTQNRHGRVWLSALPVLVAWLLCLSWSTYRAIDPGEGDETGGIVDMPLEAMQSNPALQAGRVADADLAVEHRLLRGVAPEAAALAAREEEELARELQRGAALEARLAQLRQERDRRRRELKAVAADLEGLLQRPPSTLAAPSKCGSGGGAGARIGDAAAAAALGPAF